MNRIALKTIALTLILAFSVESKAQSKPEETPRFQYATVNMMVFSKSHNIWFKDDMDSPSPVLVSDETKGKQFILQDYTDPKNPKKLKTAGELIMYMAKFGWELKTSNIINTDRPAWYLQVLIFERPIVQPETVANGEG